MRHTDNPGTLGEQLPVFIQQEFALVIHRNHLDGNSTLSGKQLPGNNVAMVFHHRKNHLIPLLHEFLTEAGDKQVDTLRRTTGEDNLIRAASIDETSHRLTRGLVQLCSLLRQEVHSAMHIGIHRIIFVRNGIHYLARFLRSGTVVKVNQRLAIYGAGKDGEINSHFLNIIHHL